MRAAPCRRAGNGKCLVVGKNETKGKPLAEDQEHVFVIGRVAPGARHARLETRN